MALPLLCPMARLNRKLLANKRGDAPNVVSHSASHWDQKYQMSSAQHPTTGDSTKMAGQKIRLCFTRPTCWSRKRSPSLWSPKMTTPKESGTQFERGLVETGMKRSLVPSVSQTPEGGRRTRSTSLWASNPSTASFRHVLPVHTQPALRFLFLLRVRFWGSKWKTPGFSYHQWPWHEGATKEALAADY